MKNKLKVIKYIFILLTITFVISISYAYFIEPNRIVVNRSTIEIDNWNNEFDDFRIVAISDIHGGSSYITEEKILNIVGMVNEQKPDIVVILGDFVSQTWENKPVRERKLKMPIETIADNLKGLRAKYGVYAVLGNHDIWYGEQEIYNSLKSVGLNVLNNEVNTIEKNGEKLRIFGMRDHITIKKWRQFTDDINGALNKDESTGNMIILEHSPDLIKLIKELPEIKQHLKLYIAGHTHGGQVSFPIVGSPMVPSSYGQTYASGHIREDDKDMFVTTGIGTSILPLRFLVPPEIAVLTIKAK